MTAETDGDLIKKKSGKVLVLGAGISGLSAAWYLNKLPQAPKISVWEARDRTGGVIETVEKGGFQIERGVDNFITTVPWGLDLCRELGLIDQIVTTSNRYRRTFVVRKGRLHPLPDGFLMMAPTKLLPLAFTPLLSPFGKIRAGLELFLPRQEKSDESMAEFVKRRLGREVYERIVEPLVSGIYAGDAQKLSVWATLPRFPEMEVKHRSLILAMKKQIKQAKTIKREEESGARYSFFVSLRHGLDQLPKTIAERLPLGTIHLNRKAVRIFRFEENGRTSWQVTDQNGISETFDELISALPANVAGDLFQEAAPEIAALYQKIDLSGVALITVAFRNEQIKRPMLGMGYVVPEIENSMIIAGSFSSYKYPHRAPEGTTMIRFFTGGARNPRLVDLSEDEIRTLVMNEVRKLLDVQGDPILIDIARWGQLMPQYNKGHLQWLEDLNSALAAYPSLAMAGNALDGVGIPNCIKNGRQAAERIDAFVQMSSPFN